MLSDCSLACIFYRSLQRPQRLKGGILTEENEGNEEEIGRSPSSLSSVSSVIFCKKIRFLAAVFPSASSARSCKMDWILTPRSVPWDRICPTVAGTMAAGCSPTQSEPSSTREKPALPKAQ